MATSYRITPRNSHGTMHVLLLSLERRDGNQHAAATAVLRSAYNHLFILWLSLYIVSLGAYALFDAATRRWWHR